jgi:hypothetical protein
MTGVPYGSLATLIFFFVILRVWFRHGPKIPLTFLGIWLAMFFTLPLLPQTRFPFELFVCFLAIALLVVERVKSTPWR